MRFCVPRIENDRGEKAGRKVESWITYDGKKEIAQSKP